MAQIVVITPQNEKIDDLNQLEEVDFYSTFKFISGLGFVFVTRSVPCLKVIKDGIRRKESVF